MLYRLVEPGRLVIVALELTNDVGFVDVVGGSGNRDSEDSECDNEVLSSDTLGWEGLCICDDLGMGTALEGRPRGINWTGDEAVQAASPTRQ